MTGPRVISGFICLALLTVVHSQSCIDSHSTYAAEFEGGSPERWLYNNIAKGAECVAISRTLTIDEKWNEYMYNIPDSEWVKYEKSALPGKEDLILSKANYSEYMEGTIFSQAVCIHACRVRPWCQSVDWSYDYDKCRLSKSRGVPKATNGHLTTYIEKPVRADDKIPQNNSLSYFRLGLKLLATQRYEHSLEMMSKALQTDKWNRMNYWAVAVLTVMSGKPASEAKIVLDSIDTSKEYATDLSATEINYFQALEKALDSAGFEVNALATEYKKIYDSSSADSKDILAGVIAARTYYLIDDMSSFRSLVDDILDSQPSNVYGLYLFLNQYTMDLETLLSQDKEKVLKYVEDLITADNTNILSYVIAMRVYKFYQMPLKVLEYFDLVEGEGYLTQAVSNGYVSEAMGIDLRLKMLVSAHLNHIYRFNLTYAQLLEDKVDGLAENEADPDLKVRYQTLLYKMKANRFFQTAFTEIPGQLGLDSIVSIKNIEPVSDKLYTAARLAQYMYRQAVVTRQLRNGNETEFSLLVNNWRKLRDNSTRFDKAFTSLVNYNLHLLNAERALVNVDTTTQEKLFGKTGFLNMAAELTIDATHGEYQVLGIYEMMAYAVVKLAKEIPAPFGRVTDGPDVPKDLAALLSALEDTFPMLTPDKLNTKAALLFAVGDIEGSRNTLQLAQDRMVKADIPWLQSAFNQLDSADEVLELSELSPASFPDVQVLFDSETDKEINSGLDKEWKWLPKISAMSPCMVYRYNSLKNEEDTWEVKLQRTLISTQSSIHSATNVMACKQRCLAEKTFECKSFTFGFNRCILQDQTYDEVSQDKQFTNVDDETYYALPTCPQATTNGFSQLLLAVKAMSNGISEFVLPKLNKAIELDPYVGLPRILKALAMFGADPNHKEDALLLLTEVTFTTDYERDLKLAVEYIINNEPEDAKNKFVDLAQKYPDDRMINFLRRSYVNMNDARGPEIAADYIGLILQDLSNATDEIKELRTISPASPRPDIYEADQLYLEGKWGDLIAKCNSIEGEKNYLGYSEGSALRASVLQLHQFALIQRGEYKAAAQLYQEVERVNRLSAFMYAAQTYAELIESEFPSLGDKKDVGTSSLTPSEDIVKAVYWTMSGAVVLVNNSYSTNVRNARLTTVKQQLDDLSPSAMVEIWKSVAEAFYELYSKDTGAKKVYDSSDDDKRYLSPSFDRMSMGLDLVSGEQLLAWASITKANIDYTQVEQLLDAADSRRPGSAVTLWLKYKLYREWRSADSSARAKSIAAAERLIALWGNGDKGYLYNAVEFYSKYPDPAGESEVKFNTQESSTKLPVWAMWAIIGVAAAIVVALVVSCIVWLCVRRDDSKEKKRVYSGSIHSANSFHENVIPGHGEVMYSGQMTEGALPDQPEMDFEN